MILHRPWIGVDRQCNGVPAAEITFSMVAGGEGVQSSGKFHAVDEFDCGHGNWICYDKRSRVRVVEREV